MKKNVCLFICMICILSLFDGCSVKPDPKNTVKLYLMSYTKSFMTNATKEFNTKYPNHTLDVTYFDNREEYNKKLNTELLAGRGPDVVLFNADTFNSIYKTMKSDVFCDINPLIEADKSFNMVSYNKKVMNCGVFDGKRLIIPLDCTLNTFITTEELLRKNGISINVHEWDMKRLAGILKTFMEKDKSTRAEFFFTLPYSFHEYVLSSGTNFVDYEGSKANFDSPEFRELLNYYRDIFVKVSANDETRLKYGAKYWEIMKDNTAIADRELFNTQSVWVANSFLNSIFKTKGRLYPLPSYDKTGGNVAEPYNMAAINSNSKNKTIAFEIVKLLLSKDLQMDDAFIPVNEEAYEEQIKKYAGPEGENQSFDIKGSHLDTIAISENLVEDLSNIKANLSKCVIGDEYIYKLMNDTAQKYVNGEYSEDQVVNELNNKVILYLNE